MQKANPNYALMAWNWILAKDTARVHWRRYVLGAVASAAGLVLLSAAYMLLPKSYTSEWSVILPGAGSDTRMSLERIGQAQSSSSSPFSDKALSPKVNYKEIVESRPVLAAAAKAVGLTAKQFGEPRIKLVDQASIILFEVTAPTPEASRERSWALFHAFRNRLDELRKDEMQSKNTTLRESIADVEEGLKKARQKLLDLQTESGLASIEQYNQLVTSIESLRRDQATARATVAEKRTELESIQRELGLDPARAAELMRLGSNPEIRQLSQAYASASSAYAEISTKLGSGHPRVADSFGKLSSVRTALLTKLEGTGKVASDANVDLPLESEGVQRLLGKLVEKSAEFAGVEARLTEINQIVADVEDRRSKLGIVAAKLDDLQRDHMIANAVFSSALARLDAGKSDHYASYPLVQMLSEPSFPDRPSSPRLLFAALAALLGSTFAALGWFFAWLHQWFVFDRRTRRAAAVASAA